MDDFTPYGDDFDPALDTLEKVLQRCIATRLCLSHEKCYMMMTEGLILGHYISAAGIQVDPAKIQILLLIPTPTTQTEAFKELKKLVSTAPVLQGPNWNLPFQISSDALDTTIGAVLGQEEDKKPYAIYYISKNLSSAELNYTLTEKEFLVVIHAVNKFRHYITGYSVVLYTDHSAIKYLANKPITNARITRWLILLQEFDITIKDRPGKENPVADFLSRIPKSIETTAVEDQFPNEHLFAVAVRTPWYDDVTNYLAVGKLPKHLTPEECKQIVQKSTRFSWNGGHLFHTGVDMQIRRCIREDEIFDILKACHDGPCGGHFAEKRTAHKVLQTGYYWPTIFKDAKKFTQACDSCQRAGRPGQADEMPLRPQLVIDPFERWALDFANGQVESSNKVIESILTKTIASHGRDWAARLPEALWAYRTTWRSTTGYSPYQLVFGKQPIFPIEFEIQTLRTAQEVSLDLSEAQINRLQQINELDEIRLSALQNTTLIQQQRAKWHDALIKNKVFHEGDWALLYDSRFQDFPRKLQTRWLGPYKIQKVHDNGTLTLTTIDGSGYAFKVNGHRVRLY
eukprot:PITA_07202